MDIDKKLEIIEACFLFYLHRMGESSDHGKKAIVTTSQKIILSLLKIEKISLKHQYGVELSLEELGEFSVCLDNLRSLKTLKKGRFYYPIQSNPNSEVASNDVAFSTRTSLQHPFKSYLMSVNIAKQLNVSSIPSKGFLNSVFSNEAHPLDTHNGSFLPLLKKQLDENFHLDKSLKAVYVDLSYNFSEVSKEIIKKHFSFFLQLLKEQRQYRGYFHKLDYSVTDGFSIFFIGLFENLKSVAVNQYYLDIKQTWERAFEKLKNSSNGLDCPSNLIAETKFRNVIADSYLFANNITIVGKEGASYEKFIEGPLAYIALIDEFLPIFLNGEQLKGDLGVIAYPSVHNVQAVSTPKKTRKHKQKKIYDVEKENLFKKYFSEIRLLKPLEKDIKDICFCYEYISEFLPPEKKEIWEKLLQIEVITLLAQHWRQPATEVVENIVINHDLNKLLEKVIDGSEPYVFKNKICQFSFLVGIRSTIFIDTFEQAMKKRIATKSEVNKIIWFNQYIIEELQNKLSHSLENYSFHNELLNKRFNLKKNEIEPVGELDNQFAKGQTVQQWLSIQERSRRQSFRKLDDYCQMLLKQKHEHKKIRIDLGLEVGQNILFFDKLIRQSMDPLQRTYPGIQGYLGGWEFNFGKQSYNFELNLFIDPHYVDGDLKPLVDHLRDRMNKKIEKNEELAFMLLNDSQVYELNLNDQSNSLFQILGEFIPEKIIPKKINLKKHLRSWCFYLAHRDLYCLSYFLPMSQKSIRGKTSYKARELSETRGSSI
ncbi:hypothetical protein [Acinetobacter lactucae]|uniref:hypothetical protein n=1 Tax=Acinetobacter calcoaceticus/baumannii complex TaxID=909768 RepID=UPI0039F68AAC